MRFEGEEADLEVVRHIGYKWGFGNCIDILLKEWDKVLEKDGIRNHSLHWLDAAGSIARGALKQIAARKSGAGESKP